MKLALQLGSTSDTVSMSSETFITGLHYDTIIMDDLINEGGEKDMMGLYEVTVVNTKTNEFIVKHTVIAKDTTRAQMKTVRKQDIDVTNDDIKFFVVEIGQWESKKPKEVKIVKEE